MSIPSPPGMTIEQNSVNSTGSSSVGPVIGVLVVIMVLGMIAVVIGRVCFGKGVMGYGQFDVESWAETKCSSCIDGRISPPPPPPTRRNVNESNGPGSVPARES